MKYIPFSDWLPHPYIPWALDSLIYSLSIPFPLPIHSVKTRKAACSPGISCFVLSWMNLNFFKGAHLNPRRTLQGFCAAVASTERSSLSCLLLRRFDFNRKQASSKHEKLETSTPTIFAARERRLGTRQILESLEAQRLASTPATFMQICAQVTLAPAWKGPNKRKNRQ